MADDELASARPAATVIVVRPAAHAPGVEVLALERSTGSRFAPGFVVFPGGAVEPGDMELAVRWFGAANHVARACALRELAEEAGLFLGVDGRVAARAEGSGPGAPGAVPEIGHWVAPAFLPVRFDARFFAALAAADAEPRPDGVEIARAWWEAPADVLEAQRAGDVRLMWPTMRMLQVLAACDTVEEALALHVDQVAPPGHGPGGPTPLGGTDARIQPGDPRAAG